jgi:hypothetical protein
MRIQDGIKLYWLCTSCETLLSQSETAFSRKLFYPYTNGQKTEFTYGTWLLHFCVSISWRVLEYHRAETELKGYSQEDQERIDEASTAWKEFLLGKCPHPGLYRQHLIPFEEIHSLTFERHEVSQSINRYLMRAIDMDLARNKSTIFVYSKLGRFVIIGFIRNDYSNQWQGSRVHATKGIIEPRDHKLPIQFFRFINRRSELVTQSMSEISPRQRARIDRALDENRDRFVKSDQFRAMQSDARLFGMAAFDEGESASDDL